MKDVLSESARAAFEALDSAAKKGETIDATTLRVLVSELAELAPDPAKLVFSPCTPGQAVDAVFGGLRIMIGAEVVEPLPQNGAGRAFTVHDNASYQREVKA